MKQVLVVLVTLYSFHIASAFTLGAQGVKGFKEDPLKVYLNSNNCLSGTRSDVKESIDLWNSVPTTGLVLEFAGSTSTPVSDFTGVSYPEPLVIGCSTNYTADSGCGQETSGCGGFGTINSRIVKGYVILNMDSGTSGYLPNKSGVTQLIVTAHELGHALGLGHSSESAALMYYNSAKKQTMNLHQDDIDGITYLYARNEPFGDGAYGCAQIAAPPISKTPPSWVLLILLPLLLLLFLKITRLKSPKFYL